MKLLYFAWIRTKIGISEETVTAPQNVADVAGLIEWLRTRGPGFADALANLSVVRVAVNQSHVPFHHPVADADEVAIFPPVTGG